MVSVVLTSAIVSSFTTSVVAVFSGAELPFIIAEMSSPSSPITANKTSTGDVSPS
jgi:hypothetical protein